MKQSMRRSMVISIPELLGQNLEFWQYLIPSGSDLSKLEDYLSQIQHMPAPTIQESYALLYRQLNLQIHPYLAVREQSEHHNKPLFGGEQSIESIPIENAGVHYLLFQNTFIDMYTIKILSYLWHQYPQLQVLKLYNVKLTEQEAEAILQIVNQNKIIKFYCDYMSDNLGSLMHWQTLLEFSLKYSVKSPYLQYLYLRGNQIDSQTLQQIFDLIPKNSQIKLLELTNNFIDTEGINTIAKYMSEQNSLEYIGLASNDISLWEDLKPLTEVLQRQVLTEQQLHDYRALEAQRDVQMKQKSKKKNDLEQLIQLEPLIANQDGSIIIFSYFCLFGFSIQKNSQFRVLNVALNDIQDGDKDFIEKFLQTIPETLQLILLGNQFEAKTKERLKKKYANIVF